MDNVLEVKDFSGGIKDSYVGAASNKGQAFTNLTIRPDLKVESRPGSTALSEDFYQVPYTISRKRSDSIYRFKSNNLYQTEGKIHYATAAWHEVVGPTGNSCFPSTSVEFDQCSYAEWNNHLLVANDRRQRPQFIYQSGSTYNTRTIGLPKIDPSVITFSAAGANSREYAFVYAHTYTIDGVEFTQRGPVSYKAYTGSITNSISTLPVLSNGADNNYDTTSIKLEIYRTKDNEDVHYKVGEVTNGTTVYSDVAADSAIDTGLLLYTDADDLDYDQPPKCKFVVQLNGAAYYLNIEDSLGDVYPYRLVQASPDQIYAANEGNTCDFDEEITGAGVAGQYVIVFTRNRTYRLEGIYDSTGAGGINKVEISRTSGCVSHKSVTQVLEGIYYAATDGFYFTDGFKTLRISEDIPETYRELVQDEATAKRIYGTYDSFDKIVYWAASDDITDDDNGVILAAHTYYGIRPDLPFTKWDGGYWPENFTASALLFYDNQLVRSTTDGLLVKHSRGTLNDVKVSTSTAPALWTQLPVIYDYYSVAYDFGDLTRRKWVTRFIAYCDSVAKVSCTIYSNNDNTGYWKELAEIKSNSPVLWGDSLALWGDASIRWNYLPIVSANRRFPAGSLRCSYKQVRISNSYTEIESSDSMGTATIDGSANTVTIDDPTYTWDTNSVDYYISFESDDYTLEWLILGRTDTVLTILDLSNALVSASGINFKVRGYRKNEAIRLLSYSIPFQFLTPSQTPYRK